MENLDRLWKLSGIDRKTYQKLENQYFDPIGLILYTKLETEKYWCTPVNTVTFASTGGDGVHYGFLTNDGVISNNTPIVMTLPCAETSNIILAENFLEFLSLGRYDGYFSLENIEYSPKEYISFLNSKRYSTDMDKEEINMLENITKEFSLNAWADYGSRLAELKLKYISQLKYSKEYYEITT